MVRHFIIHALLFSIPTSVALADSPSASLPPFVTKLQAGIDADTDRLVGIYKDLHQNPELAFMEVRTSGMVAKELKSLGYDVKTGIGQTGVVGIMKNGDGPVVMYRADMDCNAVLEATGLPFASTKTMTRKNSAGKDETVPVMHACGHDAHITWLLGIAKVFAANKSEWKGTLVLLAQPAEEVILGAKAMVADGMYTKHGVPKPDYLVGLHTSPIATGTVKAKSGELMAGTDQLDVTFHGVGGHGSSPHLAKDPVVMAATAVVEYQTIVSRRIDPQHPAVVTVGAIQAGTDNNVIPSSALLKVNLRWYVEKDRDIMLDAIERINQAIASSYNLPEDLRPTTVMKGRSTVLANDPELVKEVTPVLQSMLGEKNVILDAPRMMGSEDFHQLVIENENHRYVYLNVGTAKPEFVKKAESQGKQYPFFNHNPDYQVDLDAIPLGAKIGTAVLAVFLAK
jgi:amidohydrolase